MGGGGGGGLNDFRFGTFIDHFPSDGAASVAVSAKSRQCGRDVQRPCQYTISSFRQSSRVNSGATDIVLVTLSDTAVETAIAQCTSRWAMARGHRLNTSIVLAAVRGLSGLFRTVSAVEPSLSHPRP